MSFFLHRFETLPRRLWAMAVRTTFLQKLIAYSSINQPRFIPAPLRRVFDRYLESVYHVDADYARVALHCFNIGANDIEQHDIPALIAAAVELGYLSWPRKLRPLVQGRSVIDIGCGTGLHGIGFVVVGATRYVGVDPRIDPQRDRVKDLRTGKWIQLGWTGADIMRMMPRIKLFSGGIEELPKDACFDVALMHNVTEHLPDLESVLATTAKHLRPDGELVFNHHNFYSWNGHHLPPKRVSDIDASDPEQKKYLDWAHLDYEPPPNHYFRRGLNKIRISDLKTMTERYFKIDEWVLVPSGPEQGAERLSDEIRARHPQLTDLDFTTQHVFCRASPKQGCLSAHCFGEQ